MTSSPSHQNKRICIAKIAGTHGVRGLVKIQPYCEDLSLLEEELFTSETENKTIKITLKNPVGKFILAQIEGITNKEDAQKIKCSLFIPREALPEIDNDDEFYHEDLKNLTALNAAGETVGKTIAVQDFGAGELLEIKPLSGQSYFVPFQNEYITDIDLDQKTITLENADHFIIE
jgi:16S rRNA processing protein RimM